MANGLLKQLGLKQRQSAPATAAPAAAAIPSVDAPAGSSPTGAGSDVPVAVLKPTLSPLFKPLDPAILKSIEETEARERTDRALNRLLREPGFREAARGFADRYGADAHRDVAAEVAARLGALAEARAG